MHFLRLFLPYGISVYFLYDHSMTVNECLYFYYNCITIYLPIPAEGNHCITIYLPIPAEGNHCHACRTWLAWPPKQH